MSRRKVLNVRFSEHVTQTAFSLSLSKSMIVCLCQIARQEPYADDLRELGLYDTAVPTNRRLSERGLIESRNPKLPGVYTLTRAGELVLELLQIAGLASQPDPARTELFKKVARQLVEEKEAQK